MRSSPLVRIISSGSGVPAVSSAFVITSSVTSSLELHLENEYIREFVGEGQLFWYYKRKNAESISPLYDRSRPAVTMDSSYYLFELPQSEGGYRE